MKILKQHAFVALDVVEGIAHHIFYSKWCPQTVSLWWYKHVCSPIGLAVYDATQN